LLEKIKDIGKILESMLSDFSEHYFMDLLGKMSDFDELLPSPNNSFVIRLLKIEVLLNLFEIK